MNLNSPNFETILKKLKKEAVIFLATDTVPGLVSLANSDKAVKEIYHLKKRSFDKPISILISNIKMAENYAFVPSKAKILLSDSLFSFTIICQAKLNSSLAKYINIKNQTIAFRIPKDPLLLKIINELDVALAATSANLSGKEITTDLKVIKRDFGNKIDYFSDNLTKISGNDASAIIDFTSNRPKIIRATKTQKTYLEKIL